MKVGKDISVIVRIQKSSHEYKGTLQGVYTLWYEAYI